MQKSVIALYLFIAISFQAQAQDSIKTGSAKRYILLDASYVFGSQVYDNHFIYNPGFGFQASYGIQLNESVSIGLGAGYTALQDEHFLPFFGEVTGCRKNKASSPVIRMQLGYAHAWHTGKIQAEAYRFRGGIFIDAGLGRRFVVNNNYSVYFHWSYRHQFARMEYRIFGDQSYTDGLNYDMLVISLGIIRR